MNEIQKTKDYSIFQKLTGNRPIKQTNVKKLMQAIERDNQLNLHPIIVNKDYVVIDGQHRLEAAKSLGVDIFYIQSENVKDSHLIDANVNQHTFEVENYIEYFAVKEKNPVYVLLQVMIKSTGLKPRALLTLILGSVSSNILDFLKTGKFIFPKDPTYLETIEFYKDFIAYAKDKRLKPLGMFTNHNFSKAIRWLYLTTGFDKKLFFSKLDNKWFELKPQISAEDWYTLLLGIYNHKNRNQLEKEYGLES